MSHLCVIPVRMGSSRFFGKPLAMISGTPMVEHCFRRASEVFGDRVVISTPDEEIHRFADSIGARCVRTSEAHVRASSRVAETIQIIDSDGENFSWVLMMQGDEPCIKPQSLELMRDRFEGGFRGICNLMSPIFDLDQLRDRNNVKVVVDADNRALYFSRATIPYPFINCETSRPLGYMQTGVIGFGRKDLDSFEQLSPTHLEKVESVDLNRIIESGGLVDMIPLSYRTVGVDTPNDCQVAEILIASQDEKSVSKNTGESTG